MARVIAYAARVAVSVMNASGSLNRKTSVATGTRAKATPAMIAGAGPNQRRTVVYSTPTVATPASACGSRRLQ